VQHLLILGGTTEARELADTLAGLADWRVTTSLVGRTEAPILPAGQARTGGFGGMEGLVAYLRAENVGAVIDATHPFAQQMTRQASEAAVRANLPSLRLERPAWQLQPNDHWQCISDWCEVLPLLPSNARVFLAIGPGEAAAFKACEHVLFIVRTVDLPARPLPLKHHKVILGRGPFVLADELALFHEHRITHIVCKNSGGSGAYAKLEAARQLSLPVIMKNRPPAVPNAVGSVEEAVQWLKQLP
jgi:precorrin-6A/cobalt-precorrin-6A reductase